MDKATTDDRYKKVDNTPTASSATKKSKWPPYTEEQKYFIWYCYVDLNMSWSECVEAFKKQFNQTCDIPMLRKQHQGFLKLKECPSEKMQRKETGDRLIGPRLKPRDPKYNLTK